MTIQLSVAARNARLDAIETIAGVSAKLMIYTGAQPASCAAAASGTMLVEFDLGADWADDAASGSKNFNSTPLSANADAGGTADHFRLYKNDGTTCVMQGSVTLTGAGGDLTLDNTNIAINQLVKITSFVMNEGGA